MKKNNLKVSGNTRKLINRVRENNLSLDEFKTISYRVSDKGKKFLKDYSWIEFYNIFLIPFDFGDFYRFYQNQEGNVKDIAMEYLKSFIKLADKNNDNYLKLVCFDIQKLINRYGDFIIFPQDNFV